MNNTAENLLGSLVAFDTSNPPGRELPLAEYLASICRPFMETRIIPVGEDRADVLMHVAGTDSSAPSLMLCGHLDVVPANGVWSTGNPFAIHRLDGRIYGRGTSDMKGGIACMITAAKDLLNEGRRFRGDLYLLFVADEECLNRGTKAFLSEKPGIRYCVIGEPTMLELCIAHRGVSRYQVSIDGVSCHAGSPQNGVNAVEKMAEVVSKIVLLNHSLGEMPQSLLPPETVAVTKISGGDKYNVIPGHCEAVLDWRTLPGRTETERLDKMRTILDLLSHSNGTFQYGIETLIRLDGGMLKKDDPLVLTAAEAYRKCFHAEPRITGFPACCEQTLFLDSGIETLICGPGNIGQAHTVDEFIEEEQLERAVAFYRDLIEKAL